MKFSEKCNVATIDALFEAFTKSLLQDCASIPDNVMLTASGLEWKMPVACAPLFAYARVFHDLQRVWLRANDGRHNGLNGLTRILIQCEDVASYIVGG